MKGAPDQQHSEITEEFDRQIEAAFSEQSRPGTSPRRILVAKLRELARSGVSFSTEELWQKLRTDHGGIGRATVFRSIEQLLEKKVLDKIVMSDGSHRYKVCGGSHHHHLVCTSCKQIVGFEECLTDQRLQSIGAQHGFAVEDHASPCKQLNALLVDGPQ